MRKVRAGAQRRQTESIQEVGDTMENLEWGMRGEVRKFKIQNSHEMSNSLGCVTGVVAAAAI